MRYSHGLEFPSQILTNCKKTAVPLQQEWIAPSDPASKVATQRRGDGLTPTGPTYAKSSHGAQPTNPNPGAPYKTDKHPSRRRGS